MDNKKIKIFLAVDTVDPPWAFYRISKQIKKAHGEEFDITIGTYRDVKKWDNYDIIVSLYWAAVNCLQRAQPGACLVCCFYDHFTWKNNGYLKSILENSDAFTFANSLLRNEIYSKLPKNSKEWIMEDGIDLDFFKPTKFPEEFTIAWVGNPITWNNIKRPELAKEACNSLGINLLTADKNIPFSDMPTFYSDISALIVTTNPEFGEGTPNPVLEALACGKPVISPPIGIVPKILKDGVNGFFYDGSIEDLKDKISLLRDIGPENMTEASRMSVRGFSWKKKVKPWREVFYSLIRQ